MSVTVRSAQVTGLDARLISVEVDISPGLHLFSIVGLADKEVQESRERIAAAIKNIGALAPHKKSQRVIVNLAPADIKKEGPAFDLAIALGYLLASNQIRFDPAGKVFLGELGLDGALRPVPGVLASAMATKDAGMTEIIVPAGNGHEAALVAGIAVYEARTITEVCDHLAGRKEITATARPDISSFTTPDYPIDFKDIHGQVRAKRALEIAAAGGHHVLLEGPPGAGKTILASALPSILPPLAEDEMFEVTKIYSIASMLAQDARPFVAHRPFRNPHHTSSHTAVIGGGTYPRPGEATLAHRGVLFMDEFPEFDRRVIESLRQPLEARTVTIARTAGTATFPAHFMLVASQNPCPCGNFGNPVRDCVCAPGAVTKYKKKISGPIMDRIDLYVETPQIAYEKLAGGEDEEPSASVRARVTAARDIQRRRLTGTGLTTNAEMGLREIKAHIRIRESLKPMLKLAHERYQLSARAYHRLLKTARTIADLAGSTDIEAPHLAEALQYRPKQEL
ncbi:MAG: magnesium chelatase [Candidatus Sungbacteria bacterium RIFCSPHIGHO2_02_FULL_52_23]|uniref:Magnesium chelatase n=1 Tax=Candidatus Sungbacteria bacterium RIFCSPHIGHO2_02_FULL_52_23 TaxID=1802274 RepID=A0A1G2KSI6_9BACT|nr:MAG: magnesium chelatase [Candidatus Sungbacteria bacterium RIFCSPHIGHO2_02_FULL_52_23]